jgi:hypothetical protein
MAKHKFTEGQLVRLEHRNSVWWYPAYCAEWWETDGVDCATGLCEFGSHVCTTSTPFSTANHVVQFTSADIALVLPMPRHMRRSSDNQHWIKILLNDRAVYMINNCLVPVE